MGKGERSAQATCKRGRGRQGARAQSRSRQNRERKEKVKSGKSYKNKEETKRKDGERDKGKLDGEKGAEFKEYKEGTQWKYIRSIENVEKKGI